MFTQGRSVFFLLGFSIGIVFGIILLQTLNKPSSLSSILENANRYDSSATTSGTIPQNQDHTTYNHCSDDPTEDGQTQQVCDYIIVGAGTTTLALAGRLTEVPHWKVCVLERGPMEENMEGWYTNNYQFTSPYDPVWLTQPAMATMVTNSYGHVSNKNKDGRLLYIPRFRGRGGTARVYGAIARRASHAVLEKWPEGWKHDDLTPYYKRTEDHYCYYDFENVTGIPEEECIKWHGKDGPMQLNTQVKEAFQTFPREMQYLCEDESMPWHGYADDYNGPVEDRISCSVFHQFKLRTDKDYNPTAEARHNRASSTARGSSYTGYYQHNENKPFLFLHSSPVTKILFKDKKAIGVRYLYVPSGRTHTLFARKEVIIGAGSFDTPHLLQVSGVGPKKLLNEINVDVVADNTHVGQHLWDHVSIPYVLKLSKESDDLCCGEGGEVPTVNIDGKEYNTKDLSSINGPFSWILHLRSNVTRDPVDMSDIQLYVMGKNSKLFDEVSRLCTAEQPEYVHDGDNEHEDVTNENEGTIRIIDQWPEYRGYVNAVTANVFDKPTLEYGWTYSVDGETTKEFKKVATLIRDQVRMLRNMFFGKDVHESLKALVLGEVAPGMHVQTDEELDVWMRGMMVPALHPACTCKMPDCVDEFLRVRGVENLRVADASAFATQTDGNPAATLYAMGEKLADMLKFQNLKYIKVAVRKELSTPIDIESSDPPMDSATRFILSITKCIEASGSVERQSTGKGTSALIVKWSLLCSEDSNEREIADSVAMMALGLAYMDGCSLRDYPLFNRDEASSPARDPTPKHASSSYVFVVWCQYYKDVSPDDLWNKVGHWNSGDGKVPGSQNCFKLNCVPEICSVMRYTDEANREFIYTESDMPIPVTDYVSTKKVVSRNHHGKSSAFIRTGSMISNPGADWYDEVAGYLLENVYASSGLRYSHDFPPLNTQDGWWMQTSDGLMYYETKGIYSGTKVASFDLDNTIIKTKSGHDFPDDENDWQFTSPNVKAKLQENHNNKINNVIMSNQNGIGLGYQDKGEWMAKVEQVALQLGVPMYVMAAIDENKYRKPDTGMWEYYTCKLNQFKTIDKTQASYTGDVAGRPKDISDADKMFAQNVGIKFNTPEKYFGTREEL